MATTSKVLFRGAAATSNTLLYTVPASTTAVVTNIFVVNTASAAATFDLSFNEIQIANDVALAANSVTAIDLKQVLNAAQTIKGLASATSVNFHISGVEIV